MVLSLTINFGKRKARPPRLSSQPACHARHERAGGGRVEIKRKVKDFDEDLQDEF
jgi:hypothetical protein